MLESIGEYLGKHTYRGASFALGVFTILALAMLASAHIHNFS